MFHWHTGHFFVSIGVSKLLYKLLALGVSQYVLGLYAYIANVRVVDDAAVKPFCAAHHAIQFFFGTLLGSKKRR